MSLTTRRDTRERPGRPGSHNHTHRPTTPTRSLTHASLTTHPPYEPEGGVCQECSWRLILGESETDDYVGLTWPSLNDLGADREDR
jgi:hypothetical protein